MCVPSSRGFSRRLTHLGPVGELPQTPVTPGFPAVVLAEPLGRELGGFQRCPCLCRAAEPGRFHLKRHRGHQIFPPGSRSEPELGAKTSPRRWGFLWVLRSARLLVRRDAARVGARVPQRWRPTVWLRPRLRPRIYLFLKESSSVPGFRSAGTRGALRSAR